jgi:hypothetical protein
VPTTDATALSEVERLLADEGRRSVSFDGTIRYACPKCTEWMTVRDDGIFCPTCTTDGNPTGGDVNFWRAWYENGQHANGTAPETAAQSAPVVQAGEPLPSSGAATPAHRTLAAKRANTVHATKVNWLWRGRVPLGKVTMVDGEPGVNKSTVWEGDIAARLTTARAMPDGDHPFTIPRHVIISSTEDDAEDTLVPRLVAAGADLDYVTFAGVTDGSDESHHLVFPQDLYLLEQLVMELNAALVVIDPVMAHADGRINTWKDQDVRKIMTTLHAMAARTQCAVVLIRHVVKNQNTRAIYAGGGSVGIIGDARSGVLHVPDPDDAARRYLVPTKSNLAKRPDTLVYHVESQRIIFPNGDQDDTAKIVWDGTDPRSADELLHDLNAAWKKKPGPIPEAQQDAEDFIVEFLKSGEDVPSKELERAALEFGISKSTFTKTKSRMTKTGVLVNTYYPATETQEAHWATKHVGATMLSLMGGKVEL